MSSVGAVVTVGKPRVIKGELTSRENGSSRAMVARRASLVRPWSSVKPKVGTVDGHGRRPNTALQFLACQNGSCAVPVGLIAKQDLRFAVGDNFVSQAMFLFDPSAGTVGDNFVSQTFVAAACVVSTSMSSYLLRPQ